MSARALSLAAGLAPAFAEAGSSLTTKLSLATFALHPLAHPLTTLDVLKRVDTFTK